MSTEATERPMRTFTVQMADQVHDGLLTTADMIEWLKATMKVKKSRALADRVLQFTDNETQIELMTEKGNVEKKDFKMYLKRYLRAKALKNFVKIFGDSLDGYRFEYINQVDAPAEEE